MAENDAMEGKKLEIHMFEQKILEEIQIAEKEKRDSGAISNGEFQFAIQIEKMGKKVKVHAFGEEILTLEEGNKFSYNIEGLKNIQEKLADNPDFDYSQFGLPDIEYLQELEKQREEEQKDEKDLSKDIGEKEETEKEEPQKENKKPEKQETEQEKLNTKSKNVQEIDLGREFSDTDDLRKYIRDILKQDCDRLYRVRTGSHDFKYMAEKDGKFEELNLTTDFEGRNTRQKIYIVDEDGKLKEEEVDSLLLTRDGNRGIATKLPDTGSSDVTKSFAVTREKGGKYVAIQLIEKSGQNRDPNLPGKDRFDRTRGREEIGDDLDNIEEIENKDMDIADDGITVQEISLYEYLEKKGYNDKEIDRIIKDVQENDISVDDAELNEKKREEIERDDDQKTPWGDAEGRRSRW